jgi:hypothetical protein
MRLIDAEVLIKKLKKTSVFNCIRNSADKNVFEIIAEQPTAYDMEKVVEELEEATVSGMSGMSFKKNAMEIIEIVRKGGIDG